MAIPSIPSQFYVQQANRQVLASWNLTGGATSYTVQRSIDGVTFANIATIATNQYLDTAVIVGTQYWYKVASVNASGTSPFTAPQNTIPTPTSEMSLAQLRQSCRQRADLVNSKFIQNPELDSYINQSMFELYDLLINTYSDYFVTSPVTFTTNGTTYLYPLPDGALPFTDVSGQSIVAEPFYRLIGVDLAINNASNAYVTLKNFNFVDRNKYLYPNSASTIYGVFNMQYRLLGNKIEFIPVPTGNQIVRLWYIPRLKELLMDTDLTTSSISGWIEYVITDVAIKMLQKEESDVSVLAAQKQALMKRIEDSAINRDIGSPDTISDTRSANGWGYNGDNGGGFRGGW